MFKYHNFSKIFEEAILQMILHFQHFRSHLFIAFPKKGKIVVEEGKEEFVGTIDNLAIEYI